MVEYTSEQIVNIKFNHYVGNHHSTMLHYPAFYYFGSKCESIVEFGVDAGYSSWAWVACRPKYLRCVDLHKSGANDQQIDELIEHAKAIGIDFEFVIADTGHGTLKNITQTKELKEPILIDIEQPHFTLAQDIDLLYIDTYHSYTHLKAELAIHAVKVKKYIIMHDTDSFGLAHDFDGDQGLIFAIEEFLTANPQWIMLHRVSYGYGLTVLANTTNTTDTPNLELGHQFPIINLPV